MIDINRLNQTTYCAIVLWLSGRFSTSQIVAALGVSEGIVKAACKDKAEGGHLPKRRTFLTRGERQALLDRLRHYRMDSGRFDNPIFFTAQRIPHEPEEPVDIPDPKSKEGKKRIRELAHENLMMRNAELRELEEPQLGTAPRGTDAAPLEWLNKERLLRDPVDVVRKGDLDRFSSEMRRYEAGVRLRGYFEGAELNGFKEVDLGKVGGGSGGMSIPERFIVARSALEAIQSMMGAGDYSTIVRVVREDEFVWDPISSKVGRELVLEDIRRALDVVALFIGMMDEKSFEARWAFVPDVDAAKKKAKSREDARDVVRTAREIILEGIRS